MLYLLKDNYENDTFYYHNNLKEKPKLTLIEPHDSNYDCYRGIITPISWDEYDTPVAFSLFIDQDEELILEPKSPHLQLSLYKFINKEAIVCGSVTNNETLRYNKVMPTRIKAYENVYPGVTKKKYYAEEHEVHVSSNDIHRLYH